MKKNYLLIVILNVFMVTSAFSQWGHRYEPEQPNQNITITTTTPFTVSVEWGEGDWTSSNFGYGTTTDGSGWTWVDLPWFEDGDGSNKRCKTDITINTSNVYYYAYRFIKNGSTTYQLGDKDWSANTPTLSAVSTITAYSIKTWTGITDSDWNTASNWSPTGVPNSIDNVIIPKLTTQPTATGAVTVNEATVASGASLIANSTFTGNITYNVHVGDSNWHLVSSPVVGEGYDNAWVTANSIASGTITPANRAIATYQNGTPNVSTGQWVYMQENGTGTFGSGVGYSLKRTTSGDFGFTGTFPDGPVNPAITMNVTNWNMIGNPYPSYIDIAAFITANTVTNANLADAYHAIFFWDAGSSSYTSPITTGYIHPGQAFFVNSKVNGTVSITKAMQSHQTGVTFYKSSNPTINLNITKGNSSKTTKINYLEGKTKGLNHGFDLGMFDGVDSDLRVFTNLIEDNQGIAFAIQALPNTDFESMVIPVGVKAEIGEITFSTETLNLPSGIKVFLEDRTTNTFTRLDETNSEYKVDLTEALNGIGRFYLHTNSSALNINKVTLENVSIYSTNNSTLRIVGLTQGTTKVNMYNVLGKQVLSTSFNSNGVKDISLPKLSTGVYIVQLENEAGKMNKKIVLE